MSWTHLTTFIIFIRNCFHIMSMKYKNLLINKKRVLSWDCHNYLTDMQETNSPDNFMHLKAFPLLGDSTVCSHHEMKAF